CIGLTSLASLRGQASSSVKIYADGSVVDRTLGVWFQIISLPAITTLASQYRSQFKNSTIQRSFIIQTSGASTNVSFSVGTNLVKELASAGASVEVNWPGLCTAALSALPNL